MKWSLLPVGIVTLTVALAAGQDVRITRGANQPNQNKWSAKAPWGETERSAPIEAQRKAPVRLFENLYYVGLQTVSQYLITTSAGLVLIDSGFEQTSDWLLDNIRKTGNDPKDVRYVLITHSHADHYGGAARIKRESGARVAMSAEDWDAVQRQLSVPPRGGGPAPTPLARDLVVKDGESLKVGDQTFKFYFTPGHTVGATSIEFQAKDGNRSYRTIVPGGLGVQYQANWGPAFKSSIEKLKKLGPWDVALGNHPFLMPKDIEIIEKELPTRGNGPHPAVLGSRRNDAFFDAILKIVDEKLVAEPPTGPPTQ
jgi:metallo-beta-lactamase class B